jgi:hypothetical protein
LFQIWWGLKDPKTWLGALSIAAPCLNVAAFGSFLPTFIKEFGFSPRKHFLLLSFIAHTDSGTVETQLYTMIPYAFATCSTPAVCILSDRMNRKGLPLLLCLATSIIGLIILLTTSSVPVKVVGCCFVSTGAYPGVVLAANFTVSNHGGYTKRCTAWAVAQVFIQCYSIISTQIYIHPPHFYLGHGVLLALNAVGAIATLVMYFIMKKANKDRDSLVVSQAAEWRIDADNEKSYEELCDFHPLFRYHL